jgi:MarR family transcriptional regulator for hemolysin
MIQHKSGLAAVPAPEAVGRQLALTTKAMREWFEARLAAHGGSLATWIVLSQATEGPFSPSQRELAERVGIGGATLVHHLDRLEAEGLVQRRRDAHDRRVTRIDITEAGRVRHAELSAVADSVDAELRSLMSSREEATFRAVLHRVAAHVAADPTARLDDESPMTGSASS